MLCTYFCAGEMAERSNAAVLKTVDPKGPGVRIPLSPQGKRKNADLANVSAFFSCMGSKKGAKKNAVRRTF